MMRMPMQAPIINTRNQTTRPERKRAHAAVEKRCYLRFIEIEEGDSDPDGAEHEQEEEQRRGAVARRHLRLGQHRVIDEVADIGNWIIARLVVLSEICVHPIQIQINRVIIDRHITSIIHTFLWVKGVYF